MCRPLGPFAGMNRIRHAVSLPGLQLSEVNAPQSRAIAVVMTVEQSFANQRARNAHLNSMTANDPMNRRLLSVFHQVVHLVLFF
jgi:hypothetical protein